MPDQKKPAIQTRIAERLDEFVKEFAPRVAEINRPVLGNVPVSKDERQRRWWDQDKRWPKDPEQSRALELRLLGYTPDGTPLLDANGQPVKGMSREDVGLMRFPNREIDARAAGRGDPRKEAEYARDMTALGPPPPEPLEAAALAVQAPESTTMATPAPQPNGVSATTMPETGGSY